MKRLLALSLGWNLANMLLAGGAWGCHLDAFFSFAMSHFHIATPSTCCDRSTAYLKKTNKQKTVSQKHFRAGFPPENLLILAGDVGQVNPALDLTEKQLPLLTTTDRHTSQSELDLGWAIVKSLTQIEQSVWVLLNVTVSHTGNAQSMDCKFMKPGEDTRRAAILQH